MTMGARSGAGPADDDDDDAAAASVAAALVAPAAAAAVVPSLLWPCSFWAAARRLVTPWLTDLIMSMPSSAGAGGVAPAGSHVATSYWNMNTTTVTSPMG